MLRDCLVILLIGGALGLVANTISPRGLSLTRDYFHDRAAMALSARGGQPEPAAPATIAEATPQRTKRGLPLASHEQVVAWYHSPEYAQQKIIFVDARDADHYAGGHIPGAYAFDHYHPEQNVATVLAAAPLADRIVVYCNGGECEDSELAYLDLVALGVPEAKLIIYGGGITEWTRRSLLLEKGDGRQP